MKARVTFALCVLGLLQLAATDAFAADQVKTINIKENTTFTNYIFSITKQYCRFGKMSEVKVTTQPTHGTITMGFGPYHIKEGECKDTDIKAKYVRYIPNKNYIGTDKLEIYIKFYNWNGNDVECYRSVEYDLNVGK